MFTNCPSCYTVFRISDEQLKKAGGKVRCGSCSTVFDAQATLSEQEPANIRKKEPALATEGAEEENSFTFNESPTAPVEGMDLDLVDDGPGLPQGVEAVEVTEFNFGAPPTEDKAKTGFDLSLDDEMPAATRAEAPIRKEPSSSLGEDEDDDFLKFDGALSMPPVDKDDASTRAAGPRQSQREMEAKADDDTLRNELATGFDEKFDATERYVMEELETAPGGNRFVSLLGWTVLSLLLIAVLTAQFAFFKRQELMKYEWAKPWVESMCDALAGYADCKLPKPRDLESIVLSERQVVVHPSTPNALLITATIVNNAMFAQPFPDMEIDFTNTEGKVVASRRFTPTDYLDKSTDLEKGMTPTVPWRIMLAIEDPGKDAQSFEFKFR